jgi:uncharacterized membrane protein
MTKTYLIIWVTILCAYLILGGIWLGIVAKNGYTSSMSGMLRDNFIILPWIIFYLLYTLAITQGVYMSRNPEPLIRMV